MKTLTTKIQFDPNSGDMFLPLPQEIIDAWQLKPGDDISWSINNDSIIVYRMNQKDLNNG